MHLKLSVAVAFAVLAIAPALAAPSAAPYKLVKSVALGAPDRWDYVMFDAASHRVYVAHGSEVSVVDGRSGEIVGTIGEFPGGTHGIGIAMANGRGYTDDGKAGAATSFDLKTLKTQKATPTAPDADGIDFDSASGHIFVINGDSGSITVIDPATDAALTTIKVGGGLEFGQPDGKGKFYVDGAENSEIVRIDTKSNAVDARWPIAACKRPHGLALDTETRRVFASCANGVMLAVDADSGKVIANLPIGQYTDFAAFDPVRKRVFSSNGDGTLSIYQEKDPNNFVALPTVTTQPSARTMALDPETGRLFVAAIDITKVAPPTTPGGRPHITVAPGSLKLLFLDPQP
jgi:YVTN family beta-propeller protein